MARTVNQAEYAAKRSEILDAAQRLIYIKGYEKMRIQDILVDLSMSSGAFFHYFESKAAVLEALIERIQETAEQPLLPIVHDPDLPALEKLQRFFDTLDRSRLTHNAFIADLLRIWFADDNAIVREKVDAALVERRTPLLTLIVHQGIREGVFTTHYPDQAGEIILSLARGMGNTVARLLLAAVQKHEAQTIDAIVATYAAYIDAVERVLGAESGCLRGYDAETVNSWIEALGKSQ
jgi:AcrR family transcriptional regulator